MEATSARMARDRYGGFTEPATTPLQRYIQNACDPQNFQPNIALNMEIVDMINAKKGSAPREAAVAIVTHANNRNPNISLLALHVSPDHTAASDLQLLDNCVKNCGYPFHLQISTKEFLNELVRRFPERPPLRYSKVQGKILELIEEWRETICQTSKYKDDLGFIRDMHRLLSYKGYMFPEVRREDAAVLNQSEILQSAEEMEEEEKAAQSAKLQELIRRGTPHDLQEANRLMKVMAGYDTRHKTDYRAKAAEEVGKVQQKARILEEMLQNHKPGDKISGDTWEELGNALASAQPRIQKMCEEESEDTEAVAKLFEINDSIHRTLERYRLTKKGDVDGASKIAKGTLGVSGAGVKKGAGNDLSLIDLGEPDEGVRSNTSVSSAPFNGSQSLENDLLGLSMNDNQDQPISLGGGNLSTSLSSLAAALTSDLSLTPQRKSNADILSAFGTGSGLTTPIPGTTAETLRPSSALSSLGLPSSSPTPQPPVSDDGWTFSSALPDEPPASITVTNTNVHIAFTMAKQVAADGGIVINAVMSNNTPLPISELTFQLAVMKGYSLSLQPQSSRSLQPRQRDGISQTIKLYGHQHGTQRAVKLRWRVAYTLAGASKEDQGEIASLGLR